MNARTLLNFRVSTLCRLLAAGSLIAGLSLAGCGTAKATDTDTGAGTDDIANGDLGVTDDGTGDSTDDVADTVGQDTPNSDSQTDVTTPGDTTGDTLVDSVNPGSDATGDVPDAKPDVPTLPICAAAKGNCKLCSLCGDYPICTLKALGQPDLATYPNDCMAICALNAVNWPTEVGASLWPAECPACPYCTPSDLKVANDQWCVTTTAGTQVNVDHPCEIGCVTNAKMQADGKTPVANKGACKLACTQPVASGGPGCTLSGQPICAKEDNTTYNNQCQMENCNVKGCYSGTTPTTGCAPGKMTKECDGACYDATKTPSCTSACSPVCGIKQVKLTTGQTLPVGMSYRSSCIAAADGASVGNCTGISATPSDACAAGTLYQARGCCPDVEYSIVHPVCGSKTVPGQPDQWVTFQNQGEYDCLKDATWTFQYPDACICNCNNNDAPVCGANGFTYQNACQAKCYNGQDFTYTTGPCP